MTRKMATIAVLAVVVLAGCSAFGGGTQADPVETETVNNQTETQEADDTPSNESDDDGSVTLPDSWETPTERETPPPDPNVEGSPPPVDDEPELTATPTPEPTPTPTPTPEIVRVEDPEMDVESSGARAGGTYHSDIHITNPHECAMDVRVNAWANLAEPDPDTDSMRHFITTGSPFTQETVEPGETWKIVGQPYDGESEVTHLTVKTQIIDTEISGNDYVECER